ncbi:MAG: ATP-binding protein [Eubacteriales bacterium]
MTKRIFLAHFISAILTLCVTALLVTVVTYTHFLETQTEEMFVQTKLVSLGVEKMGISFLEETKTSLRLTWIDQEGEVLYDSDKEAEMMENHLDRKEVVQALEQGTGTSSRQSETLFVDLLYVAVRLEDGTVLRTSTLQSNLKAFIFSIFYPLFLVMFLAGVMALVLAFAQTRSIMKPLTTLDLEHPLENAKAYEEITPFLQQIQKQYEKIEGQILELSHRQEEFTIITKNMGEGLVLLDAQGHILSINDAASRLFQVENQDILGRNILTLHRSLEMMQIVEEALTGEPVEGSIVLESQIYQVNLSPIFQENRLSGFAILLVNTTEKSESEKIRREFTANVSHELKTPLHSISGCAELMSHNLVKEEDIPSFSQQIYTEAQRLIRLVDEIISLSRLEEGMEQIGWEMLDLTSIAKEVCKTLGEMAKENEITLHCMGEPLQIRGSYTLLSVIVRNLCENAIKYNRQGGKVDISVRDEGESLSLVVKDTGIGVSVKDKDLIFQRFYRVDKSRSKEIGGTGLGLSIVKHAVSLHQGKISVESTLGEGTRIQIDFPKSKGNTSH